MTRRNKFIFAATVASLILIFGAVRLLTVVSWVGHCDIDIGFVVVDANTGSPIPNATIHIRADGHGFCKDREPSVFMLDCDANGYASQMDKCMCFGTSRLFSNSFGMHLPHWWYSASAPGFTDSEQAFLDDGENNRRVKRGKPAASLSVTVPLIRNHD
jgi:hypothetical protein